FQADDGIRDFHVTGVQTCALPISSKILAPEKTVLIPDSRAGCSLAASITGEDVRRLRDAYPGVPIVAYVNTSAEVKAEVDICCKIGRASCRERGYLAGVAGA